MAGWLILERFRDIYYYLYLMIDPEWRETSITEKYLTPGLIRRSDRMNISLNVILIVNLVAMLYTVLRESGLPIWYNYMMLALVGATIYVIAASYRINDKIYGMLLKSVCDIENIHNIDNATKQVMSMSLKHMKLVRDYIVIILIDLAYAVYL